MKKKFVFCLAILIVCAAVFTGCDKPVKEIVAICPLDHVKMVLPIDFESAYTPGGAETSFTTVYTLKGICNEINKMSSDTAEYSAELYEVMILIRMTTKEDSKLHFFAVFRNLYSPNINSFTFDCPTADLSGGTILIPYHLIDYRYDIYDYEGEEVIVESEGAHITENQRFELTGTRETFADFYRETGAYDVTESENRILLTVKEGAYSKLETEYGTFDATPESKWFTVDFIERNGKTYVLYRSEPLE